MRSSDLPEGWLTDAEAVELQRLAAGKVVLELGAWKGRSTVALAQAAQYVVSVDRHEGIPGRGGDSLPDYLKAVRPLANVAIVVARFADIVPLLGERIQMVYIDGDHTHEAVEQDTVHALLLDPDLVAFHDLDFPEVRAAATAVFGEPDGLVGSIASFDRRKP